MIEVKNLTKRRAERRGQIHDHEYYHGLHIVYLWNRHG